jgi:hypothetical protein
MAGGNRGMYSRYTGPMTDRAEYEDLLGEQPLGYMMGGDDYSAAVINDMLQGTGDQYTPEGVQMPPMFPGQGDPIQDFIQMQLAGDVVNMPLMRQMGSIDRQMSTDPMRTMAGQHSIGTLGGRESPYLDLLNILAFPGGGSMAPPIRRR